MRGLMGVAAGLMAAATAPGAAIALEIKTAPADQLYAAEANARRGYFDLMMQTIIIHNDAASPVTLTGLQLDAFGADGRIASKTEPIDDIVATTEEYAGMAAGGMGVFLAAQVLNEGGPKAILGDGAEIGPGPELAPGAYALSTGQYLATDFRPDALQITVSYLDEDGRPQTTRRQLEVIQRNTVITYRAPLRGAWRVSGLPILHSHHRFIPSNEFALDLFKTGPNGELDQDAKRDATDDYGYGEPVLAMADGEVAFIINGQVQDADALSRRDDETVAEARQRITQYQMQRFAEDFRAAATGNLVILRHRQGDVVEYSSYGHLKEDSITVGIGDRVRQGDVIGAVGNTGDSTLTHLHVQLNTTSDPFFSPSLPLEFENAEPRYVGDEPGLFMTFSE
ncbi:MAG: M23 family metallopeptidase [Pseudomonadota bacterium]